MFDKPDPTYHVNAEKVEDHADASPPPSGGAGGGGGADGGWWRGFGLSMLGMGTVLSQSANIPIGRTVSRPVESAYAERSAAHLPGRCAAKPMTAEEKAEQDKAQESPPLTSPVVRETT
jgi:hypothetical protein